MLRTSISDELSCVNAAERVCSTCGTLGTRSTTLIYAPDAKGNIHHARPNRNPNSDPNPNSNLNSTPTLTPMTLTQTRSPTLTLILIPNPKSYGW